MRNSGPRRPGDRGVDLLVEGRAFADFYWCGLNVGDLHPLAAIVRGDLPAEQRVAGLQVCDGALDSLFVEAAGDFAGEHDPDAGSHLLRSVRVGRRPFKKCSGAFSRPRRFKGTTLVDVARAMATHNLL